MNKLKINKETLVRIENISNHIIGGMKNDIKNVEIENHSGGSDDLWGCGCRP